MHRSFIYYAQFNIMHSSKCVSCSFAFPEIYCHQHSTLWSTSIFVGTYQSIYLSVQVHLVFARCFSDMFVILMYFHNSLDVFPDMSYLFWCFSRTLLHLSDVLMNMSITLMFSRYLICAYLMFFQICLLFWCFSITPLIFFHTCFVVLMIFQNLFVPTRCSS